MNSMSKVIIIDTLTDEQVIEIANLVKKFEDENCTPLRRIDYTNGWVIADGQVKQTNEVGALRIENLYDCGLYRRTKKECEKLLKKMQIEHRLREWSKLCEDEIDWSNFAQYKNFITKGSSRLYIDYVKMYQSNNIYFTDKSILQKAIADIGEQKLIDDYLVEV